MNGATQLCLAQRANAGRPCNRTIDHGGRWHANDDGLAWLDNDDRVWKRHADQGENQ